MLDDSLFVATDAAVARACGSKDPEIVAECNGILVAEPLVGSIIGMAIRYRKMGVIACNARLPVIWHDFGLWHELAHVLRKHVDDPAFKFHADYGLFTQPVDSRIIPRQECEANLISAEYNLDTNMIIDLIGYHQQTIQDYRALKKQEAEIAQACRCLQPSVPDAEIPVVTKLRIRTYQRKLFELEEQLKELVFEMSALNYVQSVSELAAELRTSETIVKYKLAAMRIRGYDVSMQELEHHDQVFRDAKQTILHDLKAPTKTTGVWSAH